ncbi:pyridoxal phosphate-dependent decarboxylase family protein [Kribbella ginsengisoli]|uniref:Glutamate/tyrosine decarboxylase-like PLP-dependent enzyme n=1 Tax=Kribbella ginsengisoli TaxID=363865 RepID=A0ABP6YBZ9_9ACTN
MHQRYAVHRLTPRALEIELYQALVEGRADDFCHLFSSRTERMEIDPAAVQSAYEALAERGRLGAVEQIADATGIRPRLSERIAHRACAVLAASARPEAIDYLGQISTVAPRPAEADVQFGIRFAWRTGRYGTLVDLCRSTGVMPDLTDGEVDSLVADGCARNDFRDVERVLELLGRSAGFSGFDGHLERVVASGRLGEIPAMTRLFSDFTPTAIDLPLLTRMADSRDTRAVRFAYLDPRAATVLRDRLPAAVEFATATEDDELVSLLTAQQGEQATGPATGDSSAAAMHVVDEELLVTVFHYLGRRIRRDPVPLDRPGDRQQLEVVLNGMISPEGNSARSVLDTFTKHIAPTVISADSPRFFAFAPNAPTKASLLFDMVVSCSSLQGISWLEAAGVVAAEEQALRFLTSLIGLPDGARGCFVSGGTQAALSALVVARESASGRPGRLRVMLSDQAHASIANSARAVGAEPLLVPTDSGRLTRHGVRSALAAMDPRDQVICVAGSAGTTNAGQIDDLQGVAEICAEHGFWFHVDAALGGAALLADDARQRFVGIELADSVVIDPHKWFFAPYDCAALLYRNPDVARKVHTQDAPYLDAIHDNGEWNPSDLAHHCSRRARGLPFWFSLAVHGTDAYRRAVEHGIMLATYAAQLIEHAVHLELILHPELAVVLFRRNGWGKADYLSWSKAILDRQIAFVTPTTWYGEPVARLAFAHPATTTEVVDEVIASTLEAFRS